jgi:hypothetical protein
MEGFRLGRWIGTTRIDAVANARRPRPAIRRAARDKPRPVTDFADRRGLAVRAASISTRNGGDSGQRSGLRRRRKSSGRTLRESRRKKSQEKPRAKKRPR